MTLHSAELFLTSNNLKIGDVLVINSLEWTIASVHSDIIDFYRESIDGSNRVLQMNERELNTLLMKKKESE